MALKPWEGNGGVIYAKSAAAAQAIGSALSSSGYNVVGSAAAKAATTAAQTKTAEEIFQKSFIDRGQNFGFSSAAEMSQAYINPTKSALNDKIAAVATQTRTFSTTPPGAVAKFPDEETSGGSILTNKTLLIAGAAILAVMLLKK